MLTRAAAALRLLRPRTILQLTQADADIRRELKRAIDVLAAERALQRESDVRALDAIRQELELLRAAQTKRDEEVAARLRQMAATLDAVALGERQTRAITRANLRLDGKLDELPAVLDRDRVAAHVHAALDAATLHLSPFPHTVVDDLLPADLYDALIEGLPPVEVFANRPVNKQQLGVPFELATTYGHRVWKFMVGAVAKGIITPVAADKFRAPLAEWMRSNFPAADADMPMACTDGRILLRTRGYRIPPHRDPKRGFVTCLFYLARPGDDERWGTQLYAVNDDEEAQHARPHWIPEARCELVKDVTFKPNRALIWLNSVGAHGAVIADDAPEGLERYAYQFRIGPKSSHMDALIATLPRERQAVWEAKGDY